MPAPADLLVIGGGVMGLFTAYEAAERGAGVTVLEHGRIGDPMTASYGRTRSFRSDYLDPAYVRLAREAMRLWEAFEARTGTRALVRCGCMNVAKRDVTPDLGETYAELAQAVLGRMGVPTASFEGAALRERFPYLDADVAHLEPDAGVVDLQAVRHGLVRALADRGAQVVEGVDVSAIVHDGDLVRADGYAARRLVITAGHGSNDVLARMEG